MTEPMVPPGGASAPMPAGTQSLETLAAELQQLVMAVDGVSALYPAHPLWQTIAGAAFSAVTGAPLPPVAVAESGDGVKIKLRLGVGAPHSAPHVARAVASAIRQHLGPRPCAVEVAVVQIGR